jgi:hypothetical protein
MVQHFVVVPAQSESPRHAVRPSVARSHTFGAPGWREMSSQASPPAVLHDTSLVQKRGHAVAAAQTLSEPKSQHT